MVNVLKSKALKKLILRDFSGNQGLNIPAVDPYFLDYAEAEHSKGNSNFNLKSSLRNASVSGFATSAKFSRVATRFDKKFGLKAEGRTKDIKIVGDYTMSGKLLVLPINGVGKANITLIGVSAIVDLRGDYFMKNGETYIDIISFKVKLSAKGATFRFENIFKGDPHLTDSINNFMNENWELMMATLLPDYETKLGSRFKDVANLVFHHTPMKMIFLD